MRLSLPLLRVCGIMLCHKVGTLIRCNINSLQQSHVFQVTYIPSNTITENSGRKETIKCCTYRIAEVFKNFAQVIRIVYICGGVGAALVAFFLFIIRKSKFPQNPKRSVRFSGKRTKRSVQKRKARNTQKAETKVL